VSAAACVRPSVSATPFAREWPALGGVRGKRYDGQVLYPRGLLRGLFATSAILRREGIISVVLTTTGEATFAVNYENSAADATGLGRYAGIARIFSRMLWIERERRAVRSTFVKNDPGGDRVKGCCATRSDAARDQASTRS